MDLRAAGEKLLSISIDTYSDAFFVSLIVMICGGKKDVKHIRQL